jgi:hypothetical protein
VRHVAQGGAELPGTVLAMVHARLDALARRHLAFAAALREDLRPAFLADAHAVRRSLELARAWGVVVQTKSASGDSRTTHARRRA